MYAYIVFQQTGRLGNWITESTVGYNFDNQTRALYWQTGTCDCIDRSVAKARPSTGRELGRFSILTVVVFTLVY